MRSLVSTGYNKEKIDKLNMNQLERLEIRIGVIRDRINALRSGGIIAPAQTWIQRYYVKKSNGKKYYYYRLMEATNRRSRTGKIQGKVRLYLGNRHSSKYKTYKGAIARRNELKLLQSRCDRLMAVYSKTISQLVSKGHNSEAQGLEQAINSPTISGVLVPAVEKLEASNEQLWYWMRAIADKLGINIPVEGLQPDSC